MKILKSAPINAFGGLNFVLEKFEQLGLGSFLQENLPSLSPSSFYTWKDIIYSFSSIYYCGGNCIEDSKTVLARQFSENPLFNLCSPDTLLRRFKQLSSASESCTTCRGSVSHQYSCNDLLADLNIKWLKQCGAFKEAINFIDYDNTIIFNQKQDSKMTYKRDYGYQPGVCFLNENKVLYLENRNGNSDAKSFQVATLKRMFAALENNGITHFNFFRADAASYQYEVIEAIRGKVDAFYIGAKNCYVEKYFTQINNWQRAKDKKGEEILVGDITFRPFAKYYKQGQAPSTYRLLVKKKKKNNGQIDVFTQDSYQYHAVITNDVKSSTEEALERYYNRGAAEKQFDILKNDFGWNQLPFSKLENNTVFLYLTALCRNLYRQVLNSLCNTFKGIRPTYRIKKFIFHFIAIPAKWVKRSRQWLLRIYGDIP